MGINSNKSALNSKVNENVRLARHIIFKISFFEYFKIKFIRKKFIINSGAFR